MSDLEKTPALPMGWQLNGYQHLITPGAQPSVGHHCVSCCQQRRPQWFLCDNGDLWLVATDGKIFLNPYGDDEFYLKYTAPNYIPWRPHVEYPGQSSYGRPKESLAKPYFRDYIGFQVDTKKCVVFWKGNIVYEGEYDGRGSLVTFSSHSCRSTWSRTSSWGVQEVRHSVLDENGSVVLDENGQAKKEPIPTIVFQTTHVWEEHEWSPGSYCYADCGYVHGDDAVPMITRWNQWRIKTKDGPPYACSPSCDAGANLYFPTLSAPKWMMDYCQNYLENIQNPTTETMCIVDAVCSEAYCNWVPSEPMGFQLYPCGPKNDLVSFIVRNNAWATSKWYRFLGFVNDVDDIPGYTDDDNGWIYEPDIPEDTPDPLKSHWERLLHPYGAKEAGANDFDVIAVVPSYEYGKYTGDDNFVYDWKGKEIFDSSDFYTQKQLDEFKKSASWYWLRHGEWVKGDGTLEDLMTAQTGRLTTWLYQDCQTGQEDTVWPPNGEQMMVCPPVEHVIVPEHSKLCCPDVPLWAVNVGTPGRVSVGYKCKEILRVAQGNHLGIDTNNNEVEMSAEWTCCANHIFIRIPVAYNTVRHLLFAEQDGEATIVWEETTTWEEAWTACGCNPTSYEARGSKYLMLAGVHSWSESGLDCHGNQDGHMQATKHKLFYDGQFLKDYDFRGSGTFNIGPSYCGVIGNPTSATVVCPGWFIVNEGRPNERCSRGYDVWVKGGLAYACSPCGAPVGGVIALPGKHILTKECHSGTRFNQPITICHVVVYHESLHLLTGQVYIQGILGPAAIGPDPINEYIYKEMAAGDFWRIGRRNDGSYAYPMGLPDHSVSGQAAMQWWIDSLDDCLGPLEYTVTGFFNSTNAANSLYGLFMLSKPEAWTVAAEDLVDEIWIPDIETGELWATDWRTCEIKTQTVDFYYHPVYYSGTSYEDVGLHFSLEYPTRIDASGRQFAKWPSGLGNDGNTTTGQFTETGCTLQHPMYSRSAGVSNSVCALSAKEENHYHYPVRKDAITVGPKNVTCDSPPCNLSDNAFHMYDWTTIIIDTYSHSQITYGHAGNFSLTTEIGKAFHVAGEPVPCLPIKPEAISVITSFSGSQIGIEGEPNCIICCENKIVEYKSLLINCESAHLDFITSLKKNYIAGSNSGSSSSTCENGVLLCGTGDLPPSSCVPICDCAGLASSGIAELIAAVTRYIGLYGNPDEIYVTATNRRTGSTYQKQFVEDKSTQYCVGCCGRYWWLTKTFSGNTTYEIHYLTNDTFHTVSGPTGNHTFHCCDNYLWINEKSGGDLWTTRHLFYKETPAPFPAVSTGETIDVRCCEDYAIVAKGKYQVKYDGQEWLTEGYTSREVIDTRDACFLYRTNLLVRDKRLVDVTCFKCDDDSDDLMAFAPIIEDYHIAMWHTCKTTEYASSDPFSRVTTQTCQHEWIANPQRSEGRAPPNTMPEERQALHAWRAEFPNMGAYVAFNGQLVSLNAGAGTDEQEKPSPPVAADMPKGPYLYVNDRNAPGRYDMVIMSDTWNIGAMYTEPWWDSCWNADYLLDRKNAEILTSPPTGVCHAGAGRIILAANGVLMVFDMLNGRNDYIAETGERI